MPVQRPWYVAHNLSCAGQTDDSTPYAVFHRGDTVTGCEGGDTCYQDTYDGTLSACHNIAIEAMVGGFNRVLQDFASGEWITYDETSGDCSLWLGCYVLEASPDASLYGVSSFQYCGGSFDGGSFYSP